MTRISSAKYLAGSRGETCKLRIAGVCRDDRATVVPCHVRDRHTGRSIKASDISVVDGCQQCHDVFDRRVPMPHGSLISDEDWHFYALRGLQDTLEARIARGLLIVPLDPERLSSERPTPPRKPPAQRKKIISNPEWPTGKKLVSRNTLKRETT